MTSATQISHAQARLHQRVAVASAAVFFVSCIFPVVAGLSKNTATFPKWWGVLDVSLAALLAALVFAVFLMAGRNADKQAAGPSYRAYRVLIHGIFAMLLIFFLFGDRIVWPNCLTGLAWRAWLLMYCLPAWLTLWMRNTAALPFDAE